MSSKFGVDSSSHLPVTAWTYTHTVTDATDHLTHASLLPVNVMTSTRNTVISS